ncbi:hypothetical protein DFP72DRAFT_856562 [Ephemerocybe angulata]|uniref:Uncharacterized protein n=1 Tax=Ephemerocybe angulata TaxID=980116 RepID=A0A8H6HFE1_9AGAR|nr:hypothetical protein DFP72DRAFT_856560 [Tulosesus angulatus]KAF6745303.1 hypothetical protein DFP72DRAFT_856562 [Tulosesus angulatus]
MVLVDDDDDDVWQRHPSPRSASSPGLVQLRFSTSRSLLYVVEGNSWRTRSVYVVEGNGWRTAFRLVETHLRVHPVFAVLGHVRRGDVVAPSVTAWGGGTDEFAPSILAYLTGCVKHPTVYGLGPSAVRKGSRDDVWWDDSFQGSIFGHYDNDNCRLVDENTQCSRDIYWLVDSGSFEAFHQRLC